MPGADARPAPNTLRAPAPALLEPVPTPGRLSPLEENRNITQGYIRLASAMQALLDPDFQLGGTSRVCPNWFAFAPHASQEAGKGMLGAAIARRIIDAAQGEASPSVSHALERAGLTGPARLAIEAFCQALTWYGLPRDVVAAFGALHGAMNLEALADPRTLWATAQRFAKLYLDAPGTLPLDKAEAVVRTLERCLNEGNVAIFKDIGASADVYLSWRREAGAMTPERVLREFSLPGSTPGDARRAYAYALDHACDIPRPADFQRLLPGVSALSLLVAAFALYEQARQAPGPAARDALIAMANNYVAWREQQDAVQPAFTPPTHRPDEVSRPELMRAMTPLLGLHFGTLEWKFTDYASRQRDRDGRLLTSQATEYNWAVFEDRWPAILTAFELGYSQPSSLWRMPPPLVSPGGTLLTAIPPPPTGNRVG